MLSSRPVVLLATGSACVAAILIMLIAKHPDAAPPVRKETPFRVRRGIEAPPPQSGPVLPAREELSAESAAPPDQRQNTDQEKGRAARQPPGEILKDSVVASLYGVFNLDALLDVALLMANCDVDPRVVPEPDPRGTLRFPLVGAPEGMSGELWLDRTHNEEFAPDVLSLHIETPPSKEKPLVEGAARNAPDVDITAWTDRDGKLKHIAFVTHMQPNGRATRDLGITFGEVEVPVTLSYSYNVADPSKTVEQVIGYSAMPNGAGTYGTLQRPVQTSGNPAQRIEDLERLSKRLLHLHSKLKPR